MKHKKTSSPQRSDIAEIVRRVQGYKQGKKKTKGSRSHSAATD